MQGDDATTLGEGREFSPLLCVSLCLSLSLCLSHFSPSLIKPLTQTHSHIVAETTLQMTLVSPSRSLVHSLCSLRPLGPQRVLIQVQARGRICGGVQCGG